MRNLQLGLCGLIRSPKLKIGHCEPIKVKLDLFIVLECIHTCWVLGMYLVYVILKLFKLGHINLIN